MSKYLLYATSLVIFASCSTAKDESSRKPTGSGPVAHNTVVECILYDGMTKTSPQLVTIGAGTEVQVTDTVSYYFLKAKVTKEGKTYTGYLQRQCFSK